MLSCMPGGNWEHIHSSTIENGNGNISGDLANLKKSIHQNIEVPDAIYVAPRQTSQKQPLTTIISWEYFWEKKWNAPWEKYLSKAGKELNYLALHKKLSKSDYENLFSGFINVAQWRFWDCYLISTIKSLARSRYFDTLMMTSIEKNKDGSYNLYFPLWNISWQKIHISKEELKLAHINWSDWYKLLEVWFAKHRLLRSNWSFLYLWEIPNIKLTKESMNKIIGWSSYDALAQFLWYNAVKRQIISNTHKKQNSIFNELRKFNPKNLDIIIVSSRRRPKNIPNSKKTYFIEGQKMYYHHAYSLYAIEKKGNQISSVFLEDPTNNKKKIKLSLFWFMSAFYQITTCYPKDEFLSII